MTPRDLAVPHGACGWPIASPSTKGFPEQWTVIDGIIELDLALEVNDGLEENPMSCLTINAIWQMLLNQMMYIN